MAPESTRIAPIYISAIIARFMSTKVAGFMKADILPTAVCISVRALFFASKSAISSSSLQNALTTRVPSRFSRVLLSSPSSFC